MRRVFSIMRRPRFILLTLLFVGWVFSFHELLRLRPRFSVQTGPPSALGQGKTIYGVSNDGPRVALSHFASPSWRLELWNVKTGNNIAPQKWNERDWIEYEQIAHNVCFDRPEHGGFEADSVVWADFSKRTKRTRESVLKELRLQMKPDEVLGEPDELPNGARFDGQGRLFAYKVRDGRPDYHPSRSMEIDGFAIDEVRSGNRVAFLPGKLESIAISPDGRSAVTLSASSARMFFWDLENSQIRATGWQPRALLYYSFSPDGRYLFMHTAPEPPQAWKLWWWNCESGEQLGCVQIPWQHCTIDNNKQLLEFSDPFEINKGGSRISYWDLATGQKTKETSVRALVKEPEFLAEAVGSTSDRFVAIEIRGGDRRANGAAHPLLDWLLSLIPEKALQPQYLLFDVIENEPLARLPGSYAQFSPNGQWLATIDDDGTLRVWELPLRKPWLMIVTYAAGATLACWLLVLGARRIGRWMWRPRKA